MKYIWRRGGTFTFGLQVVSGTVVGDETVRCVLKAATKAGLPTGDAAADAVVFTTSFVAAVGNNPAYWLFTGSATQGQAIPAGDYIADARIVAGSTVIQTAPILIKLAERVTEPS